MTGAGQMPALLMLTIEQRAHLVHALRRHHTWLRQQGLRPPEGIDQIAQALAGGHFGDRQGQAGTPLAAPQQGPQPESVTPLLMTYDETALRLSVSTRTVKRLVASGDLKPVRISGAVRLHVDDVNAYAASCRQKGA